MAEFMLRERLAGREGVHVASAGVQALVGEPADANVVDVMQAHGVDASAHRARQVDAAMLRDFDVVLPVEQGHRRWLEQRFPQVVGRVHTLGRWRDEDIPDPYRLGRAAFDRTYELIDECLDDWLQRL